MEVTILEHTNLITCSIAIRTCWQSFKKSDNGGEKDKELIDRVGNKNKHKSTLEHLHYTFSIKGISRACLQELARHRMASLSVKSTRYTLKELKEDDIIVPISWGNGYNKKNVDILNKARKYIVLISDENLIDEDEALEIDMCNVYYLNNIREKMIKTNISNDIIKYMLPEAYKTDLIWSINARSLQNFLELRTSKSALWEIKKLANMIYGNLPDDHKYIFKESISFEKESNEY